MQTVAACKFASWWQQKRGIRRLCRNLKKDKGYLQLKLTYNNHIPYSECSKVLTPTPNILEHSVTVTMNSVWVGYQAYWTLSTTNFMDSIHLLTGGPSSHEPPTLLHQFISRTLSMQLNWNTRSLQVNTSNNLSHLDLPGMDYSENTVPILLFNHCLAHCTWSTHLLVLWSLPSSRSICHMEQGPTGAATS